MEKKSELKVGDAVERINSDHGNLKVGDIRKVTEIGSGLSSNGVTLENDLSGYVHKSTNLKKIEDVVKCFIVEREGVLESIQSFFKGSVQIYDFENSEIRTCTDKDFISLGRPISEIDFFQLVQVFTELNGTEFEEVEEFEAKTKYILFRGDFKVHGYSSKTREDLTYFIETYGRKNGFRSVDINGITTGFVSAELLSTLSYSLDDLR